VKESKGKGEGYAEKWGLKGGRDMHRGD